MPGGLKEFKALHLWAEVRRKAEGTMSLTPRWRDSKKETGTGGTLRP